MGRYRTCLILALPEFDTLGVLRRLAVRRDNESHIAFALLLRRAERALMYEASKTAREEEDIVELVNVRIGCKSRESEGQDRVPDLSKATHEERMAFYMETCRSLGIKLDESILTQDNRSGDGK